MVKFLDLQRINDSFEPELTETVNRVIRSGWYLLGEENRCFEEEYSRYIGVSHTVGCANGLDALTLILRAYKELGVMSDGDEVIVPANTYIATILSITENSLVPVLVEPDKDTLQIDIAGIESCITPLTKAIMSVHLYGRCSHTSELDELRRRYNLKLIEDNAQAHGCMFKGQRTGSLGDAAAHSFYPGKNLGALGDGGAVTTSDAVLAGMVRRLANFGSDRKYVFDAAGRNSRLDEIQAAVLRLKLKRLDSDNRRRRAIAARYIAEIDNPMVSIPSGIGEVGEMNVYHLFPVLCRQREQLQQYLSVNGVQTLIHYPIPPHRQKCYASKGILRHYSTLSITECIHNMELSLPISPVMTDDEVTEVIAKVNNFNSI